MNSMDKYFKRRILLTVLLIAVCCTALVFGILLPFLNPNARAETQNTKQKINLTSDSPYSQKSFCEYGSIEISLKEGAVFYNGYSTVGGIKQNLTVTGTYNGVAYPLSSDEYSIVIAGLSGLGNDEYKFNFDSIPENGLEIPFSVECVLPSGKVLTAESASGLIFVENLPDVTAISVKANGAISSDNNQITVKNHLTVTATLSGGTTVTLGNELYDVNWSGTNITVTYNSLTASTTCTVTDAVLKGILVGLSSDVTILNEVYYNGEYNAFVAEMENAQIYKSITVRAYYENSSETALDAEGNIILTKIRQVTGGITNSSYSSGSQTINVKLTDATGTGYESGLTVKFEERKIVKITPKFEAKQELYSYTPITTLNVSAGSVTVIPTYNDGTEGDALTTGITLSGSLTPLASQLSGLSIGDKYDKEITVTYTSGTNAPISATLEIKDIIFAEPTNLESINGEVAVQVMTQPFDFTGLYVVMSYAPTSRQEINVYLTDIDKNSAFRYSVIYYSDDNGTQLLQEGGNVPNGARAVDITVEYTTKTGKEYNKTKFLNIETIQAPLDHPQLDLSPIDYDGENCVKVISGLNSDMVVAGNNSNVNVVRTSDEEAVINFLSGGTFTVTVTLTGGADGLYQWADSTSNNPVKTPYVLTYTITVNKGKFDIIIDNKDEWTYGDTSHPKFSVKGEVGGTSYDLDSIDGLEYKLYFYGWDNRTYDNIIDVDYDQIDTTVPDDAGDYYVIVVTKATEAYEQSVSYRWNALPVTIKQKEVSVASLTSPTYTKGVDYTQTNIIAAAGLSTVAGDKIDAVYSVTDSDGNSTFSFTDADSYTIYIKLLSSNYVWADGTELVSGDTSTAEATFTISRRTLSLQVSVDDITYGDTSLNITETENNGGGYFYAEIDTVVYTDASGKTVDISNISSWNAGTYTVTYTTKVADGDKEGNYTTPTATANFEVKKFTVTELGFNAWTGDIIYDASNHPISLENWDKDTLPNSETYDGVFSVEVAFTRNGSSSEVKTAMTGGIYNAVESGTYIVTITFASGNYRWASGATSKVSSDFVAYIIVPRTLTVNNVTEGQQFTYSGSAQSPAPVLSGVSGHSFSVTTEIYNSDRDKVSPINVGTYYLVITAFNETTGINNANYVLPEMSAYESKCVYKFVIIQQDLNAPDLQTVDSTDNLAGNSLTVIYNRNVRVISNYISNWTDFMSGSTQLVEIKILKDSSNATLKNADSYSVYIYPTSNYKWASGVSNATLPNSDTAAYLINFTIEQFTVTLTWSNTDSQVYNNTAKYPTVNVNPFSGDVLSVENGNISFSAGSLTDGKAVNAGVYTAYVDSLSGSASDNYKIDSANNSHEFTILKSKISRPTLPEITTNPVFDGGEHNINFSSEYLWNLLNVAVSGTIPNEWWTGAAGTSAVSGGIHQNGVFTYTNAGRYIFTVSINDTANYCWSDEDQKAFGDKSSSITLDGITVERKTLTFEAIGTQRTQEWTNVSEINFGSSIEGVAYTVLYGELGSEPSSGSWLGGTGSDCTRGIYYAQLKLNVTNVYNYVWVENKDDTSGRDYSDGYGSMYYDSDGVYIRLHYAITSSLLDVRFVVNDYNFGDNAQDGVSFNEELVTDSKEIIYITGNDTSTAIANVTEISYTFYKKNNEIPYTDLSGNLPWEAGDYTVKITVTFGDGTIYQAINASIDFTVNRLLIEVEWDADEFTYNNQTQMRGASVTNNSFTKTDGEIEYNLTLTVSLSNGGTDPKNADTYNINVSAIGGEGASNFTYQLNGQPAIINTFTIKPYELTVKGIDVEKHVYGDTITDGEKSWTYIGSKEFFEDGASECIIVTICDYETEIDRLYGVGSYNIVLSWKDGSAIHQNNYSVNFDNTGTFKVVQRQLTVTFVSGNANSAYGEEVDLYRTDKNIYTLSTSNGTSNGALAGVPVTEVFTLESDASNTAVVGRYGITKTAINDNFDVTFSDGDWQYEIVKAEITESMYSITGLNAPYNASAQDVITSTSVTLANEQQATLRYSKDKSIWSNTVPTETNAGEYTYYVEISNANYNTKEAEVSVSISKISLTVSANISIYYGEENPASVGYKTALSDLRDANGIYTVTGFAGNDSTLFYSESDFHSLAGTISYTTDYTKGDAPAEYTITLSVSNLTCTNYTFTAGTGTLTVNKIVITVVADDKSVTYYDNDNLELTSTNTLPDSVYGGKVGLYGYSDYSEIFTLKTDGIVDGKTAGVGTYDITYEFKNSANTYYEIEFTKAEFKVTEADLTVSEASGYNGYYTETKHSIAFESSDIAETVDGSEITVKYISIEEDSTQSDIAGLFENGTGVLLSPEEYINVGKYSIYYQITASNHKTVYGVVVINIIKADNSITGFKFENDNSYSVSGLTLPEEMSEAWVYGLYSSEHTDGFNSNGNHAVTTPEATFKNADGEGANPILVKLYYSPSKGGSLSLLKSQQTLTVAQAYFTSIFENSGFDAGYYVIEFSMNGTDNYNETSAYWAFYVQKQSLTVTADSSHSYVYGTAKEDIEFEGVYTGLVKSTLNATEDDSIEKALGATPTFSTNYSAGRTNGSVGTHTIIVNANSASTNYEVSIVNGSFEIYQRTVTITIDDKENTYNLQNGETSQALTFKVTSGSFYENNGTDFNNDNQNIITLYTGALTSESGANTNDVILTDGVIGGYAIYAKFNTFTKDGKECSYGLNYIIKFENCSMNADGDGVITEDGTNNAGKYTIKQATLNIGAIGGGIYHKGENEEWIESSYYSGTQKYYRAEVVDNSSIEIYFTYKDQTTGKDVDKVINAGSYTATVNFVSPNYTSARIAYPMVIQKATITLSAVGTNEDGSVVEVQLGTDIFNEPAGTRWTGFEYSYSSTSMLNGILDAYFKEHTVSFTTGYDCSALSLSRSTLKPVCNWQDSNVNIICEEVTLIVLARKITVEVKGYYDGNNYATCSYLGTLPATQDVLDGNLSKYIGSFLYVAEGFGELADSETTLLNALGIQLTINKYIAGDSPMTYSADTQYFNVAFANTDSADPVFRISKAGLTLTADNKSVIYGNNAPAFTYSVSGMMNGESYTKPVGITETYTVNYTPWATGVGIYSILIDEDSLASAVFDNYKIVKYVTGTLTVNARTITVSTQNQTYTEDGSDYHNGEYGASHEAVLTYSNAGTGNYAPTANLVYSTVAEGTYQKAGAAPRRVGDYTVKVTLTGKNYIFLGDTNTVTLNFKIEQQVIDANDLGWNNDSILLSEEQPQAVSNLINDYIDAIMEVILFQKKSGSAVATIPFGDSNTVNTYYFDADGRLCINAQGIASYTVQFQLKESALHNYKLVSSNATVVVSTFYITTDYISMTLTIDDWTYGDTPKNPVVNVNGYEETNAVISWASVTDDFNIDEYYGKGDLSSVEGLSVGPFMTTATFNAGYYVVCAYFNNGETASVRKYYVFRVDRQQVSAPEIAVDGYTFNGQQQSLEIENSALGNVIRVSWSGEQSTSATGIVLKATSARTYYISLYLSDTENYIWADGQEVATDGAVVIEWTIAPDNGANNGHISVPEENLTVYGDVFSPEITVKDGYDSSFSYYYTAKTNDTQPEAAAEGWISGLPVNANDYWIKIQLNATDDFTAKAFVAQLTIARKQAIATAYGTVTYGDDWKTGTLRFTVTGLLGTDSASADASLNYTLAGEYGKLQAGGEYYVILETQNNIVVGLSAGNNYYITASAGLLTVNKRTITVTVGNTSSDYSIQPDTSKVVCTATNLANGDSVSGLNLVLTTTATKESVAGFYPITVEEYDNGNYDIIRVYNGIYTVNRIRISVELIANNAYYGDADIVGAEIGEITCSNSAVDIDIIKAGLQLSFTYSGTSYSGITYNNSVTVPTQAGQYTAILNTSGVNNENCEIINSPYVIFLIEKRIIDSSVIEVVPQAYTGNQLLPQIIDRVYGSEIYSVTSATYINAGSHFVELRLKDTDNNRWLSTNAATVQVEFEITKIQNSATGLAIKGWTYGAYSRENIPTVTVASGNQAEIIFMYSSQSTEGYTTSVPTTGDVGTYYLKVYVPESTNYLEFYSEPVKFEITKVILNAPTITVNTDGENKNDVFTGNDLQAAIVGYNSLLMSLAYDGNMNVGANTVTVIARNAGEYAVRISVIYPNNYCWNSADDTDGDGIIELVWNISRMKVSKPTASNKILVVNGEVITYLPNGFNETIMSIEGNEKSYGGKFTATVSLIDTLNYEWEDGTVDSISFEWRITGADTVFAAVLAVLAVLVAAAVAMAGVQAFLKARDERIKDLTMQEIEQNSDGGEPENGENADSAESSVNEGGNE